MKLTHIPHFTAHTSAPVFHSSDAPNTPYKTSLYQGVFLADRFMYASLKEKDALSNKNPHVLPNRLALESKLNAYRALHQVAVLQFRAICEQERQQQERQEETQSEGVFWGAYTGMLSGEVLGGFLGTVASAAATSGPFWALHPVLGGVVTIGLTGTSLVAGFLGGAALGGSVGEAVATTMASNKDTPANMSEEDLSKLTHLFNQMVDTLIETDIPTPEALKKTIGNNKQTAYEEAEKYGDGCLTLQATWENEKIYDRLIKSMEAELLKNPRNADWLKAEQVALFKEENKSRLLTTQRRVKSLLEKLTGVTGVSSKIPIGEKNIKLEKTGFQARVQEFLGKATPFKTRVSAFRDVPVLMKELEIDKVPEVGKLERSLLLAITDGSENNFPSHLLLQRRVLQVKALRHWLKRQEEPTEEFQNIITAALQSNHKALQKEAYLGYREHPFTLPLLNDSAWQQDMQPYLEKWDALIPPKTYSLLPEYD